MNTKDTDSISAGFIAVAVVAFSIAAFFGVMLYGIWATSFVIYHLWQWFIVPTFGLHALTYAQSYGIALIVGFLTYHHVFKTSDDTRSGKTQAIEVLTVLFHPWITLFIGWLVHAYWM